MTFYGISGSQLLLSGMSDEQQLLEDNLLYADRSYIGMVSEEENAMYKKAKEIFDSMALVGCTGCRYCVPCPFGLEIPEIFPIIYDSSP